MIFVYSKGDEFCSSIFAGSSKVAIANGYKETTDEMYRKLLNREAHWVNEELVDRVKPQSEIDEESERKRIAEIDSEILELKIYLSESDYKAIKYAEGWISEEEYKEIKGQRQAWRDRINELEEQRVL